MLVPRSIQFVAFFDEYFHPVANQSGTNESVLVSKSAPYTSRRFFDLARRKTGFGT
jgi:hypothetical protein